MTSNVLRGIALVMLLCSVSITILRITGVISWDLGSLRPVILIFAIILLLTARKKSS